MRTNPQKVDAPPIEVLPRSSITVNRIDLRAMGRCRRIESGDISIFFLYPPELNISDLHLEDFAILVEPQPSCAKAEDSLVVLGLDFGLIVINGRTGATAMCCGHRNTIRLYYKFQANTLQICDYLPRAKTAREAIDRIDARGIVRYFASAFATGPFDVYPSDVTACRDWSRVPSSHIASLIPGERSFRFSPFDNIFEGCLDHLPTQQQCANELKDAIDRHAQNLAGLGALSSEVSGGIDSGIVFSRLAKNSRVICAGGVFVDYPFFEFARERSFRLRLLEHVGTPCFGINFMEMLPYSGLPAIPHHDEPSVNSTSWCQFSAATSAIRKGTKVLFNGHGGDRMFLCDPRKVFNRPTAPRFPGWMPRNILDEAEAEADRVVTFLNRRFQDGLGGDWHPTMFEAGWLGRYAQPPGDHSIRYLSGLLSRETLRAMARLWHSNPPLKSGVQKPIAYFAFSNDLPLEIWERPGKVNHAGITYRGVLRAASLISDISQRWAGALEAIDVSPRHFKKYTEEILSGKNSGSLPFTLLFSILIWLECQIAGAELNEVVDFEVDLSE